MVKIIVKSTHHLQEEGYRGASLQLPASENEMFAALERAQVPHGSGAYILAPSAGDTPGYIANVLESNPASSSLAEVNHLAGLLEKLEPMEQYKLEGIATQRPNQSIADLINSIHNLHRYSLYPGFTTDRQLGEHAIDNEIFPEFAALSDSALECLDLDKVGARLRMEEGGVLTQAGYTVPEDTGWDVVYDGFLAGRPTEHTLVASAQPIKMKYYCQLEIRTDSDSHFADGYEIDSEEDMVDLPSYEVRPHRHEIHQAIRQSLEEEGTAGLAPYADRELRGTVTRIMPTVEFVRDEMWGAVEVEAVRPLTPQEESLLMEEITGQMSDGWGEGFEQHPVRTRNGDLLYISFWNPGKRYRLIPEQEMHQSPEHTIEPTMGI